MKLFKRIKNYIQEKVPYLKRKKNREVAVFENLSESEEDATEINYREDVQSPELDLRLATVENDPPEVEKPDDNWWDFSQYTECDVANESEEVAETKEDNSNTETIKLEEEISDMLKYEIIDDQNDESSKMEKEADEDAIETSTPEFETDEKTNAKDKDKKKKKRNHLKRLVDFVIPYKRKNKKQKQEFQVTVDVETIGDNFDDDFAPMPENNPKTYDELDAEFKIKLEKLIITKNDEDDSDVWDAGDTPTALIQDDTVTQNDQNSEYEESPTNEEKTPPKKNSMFVEMFYQSEGDNRNYLVNLMDPLKRRDEVRSDTTGFRFVPFPPEKPTMKRSYSFPFMKPKFQPNFEKLFMNVRK